MEGVPRAAVGWGGGGGAFEESSHRHCWLRTEIKPNWLTVCVCAQEKELGLIVTEGFLFSSGFWLFEELKRCSF